MESSRTPSIAEDAAAPAPAARPGAAVAREPESRPKHILELDGIRGIAIVLVFLHHYITVGRGDSPVHRFLASAAESLWCGVDLFFVLSGFLITGILLDTRDSPTYFRTFFARRSLRIFPPYFGLLAVSLLILPRFIPFDSDRDRELLANQGWLWTYLANFRIVVAGYAPFQGDHVWLPHLWSLAVEEHFYLVWPWLVYAVSPRSLRRACLGCIAGALALRAGLLLTSASPEAAYVATPCRIDSLALGGLAALMVRDPGADAGRLRRVALGLLAVAGPILLLIIGRHGGLFRDDPITSTVGYTTLALFSAGLILATVAFDPSGIYRRALRLGPLRALGRYSYGLYLYHVALEPSLNAILSTGRIQAGLGVPYPAAGLIRVGSTFAICFAVALLSWHLFEKPILGLKRRFEYARPARSTERV
ncbi:acyltransferase family protein [Tundrisphaera sp. TA3]|uniref:acyltransferase family protein n=1 Tax=Tundrisphaera sp. TA3 TaxID=3435775 RepID=UPI003EBBC960